MRAEQNSCRQAASVPPFCDMKLVNCGTMKVMKMVISADAGEGEERRINQRLLHAVAQIFRLHQVLDQARQNIGQRAAGFAGARPCSHKAAGRCAGNRAAPARNCVHPPAPGAARCVICWTRGCFSRFSSIDKAFVERHARLKQMAELLGENQQLAVRNLKVLCRGRSRRRGLAVERRGSAAIASIRIGVQFCCSICRMATERSATLSTPSTRPPWASRAR